MDYRHWIIIGSVILCMSFTLGGLKYYYSPTNKNISNKKFSQNRKTQVKKSNINISVDTPSSSNFNLSKIKYVKPSEHTLMVDSEKDGKKFTGIMKNLGVVVK